MFDLGKSQSGSLGPGGGFQPVELVDMGQESLELQDKAELSRPRRLQESLLIDRAGMYWLAMRNNHVLEWEIEQGP